MHPEAKHDFLVRKKGLRALVGGHSKVPTGRATCSNCTNFSPDASRVTPPPICEKLRQLRKVARAVGTFEAEWWIPVEDFFAQMLFLCAQKNCF